MTRSIRNRSHAGPLSRGGGGSPHCMPSPAVLARSVGAEAGTSAFPHSCPPPPNSWQGASLGKETALGQAEGKGESPHHTLPPPKYSGWVGGVVSTLPLLYPDYQRLGRDCVLAPPLPVADSRRQEACAQQAIRCGPPISCIQLPSALSSTLGGIEDWPRPVQPSLCPSPPPLPPPKGERVFSSFLICSMQHKNPQRYN